MKKKIHRYTNEPIGRVKVIVDTLPKPSELVMKKETAKVTLLLNKSSIDYFKSEAEKHHVHYQAMMRSLLDKYSEIYQNK